jgi:hypothetical protein
VSDVSLDRQQLERVCDRLRGLSEAALVRNRQTLDGASAAGFVHEVCSQAAQAVSAPAAVPLVHPLASADQLAVVGRELLDAVASAADAGAGSAVLDVGLAAGLEQWREGIERLRQAV